MPLIDALPQDISTEKDFSPLMIVKADINEEGSLAEQWVVLTATEVSLITSDGTIIHKYELSSISEAKIASSVGGSSLQLVINEEPIIFVRYTSALNGKFSIFVQAINNVIKGEKIPTISDKDLPRLCPSCQRPLQEGTNVCPICVDKKRVVLRLLKYALPYRAVMVTAALLLILATLLEIVPPIIIRYIIDHVLIPLNIGSSLLWLVIALGATSIILAGMQTFRGYLGVWAGSKIMGDIRRDTFHSLLGLSLRYFDRRQTSQFIGRVNSDAEAIRQFLTDGVVWILGQIMMLIAIVSVMFYLNWKLALLAILPTPLILITSMIIWPIIRRRWYRQWRSINRLNMIVGDSLQGFRVVKAFGQESMEKNRYGIVNNDLKLQTLRMDGFWQGVFPLFSFLTGLGMLLVWYYGGWSVLNEEISLGTLMAFTAYLAMFFGPLQWFSQAINWFSHAISAADRIFEIMDTTPDVPEAKDAKSLQTVNGQVNIEQVTFGYENHAPVLKDINLSVEAGEMIGFVGHSGAGKSTLINLICRFYDPDKGSITIDGIDLRDIKQEDLHQHIGVVLQETFLFDGTVAENIAYSKPDASPFEIMQAAKIANAHDFIVRMQDGYDTPVGERGHRLSGGEKQRIAIARAILHDPKILILDEATASVDTETERNIQEAISRLIQGRTTFAIAHRLSTLRNANRLVVLDKGKIEEIGTHQQLIDKKGVYYKLVEAQREMSQIKGVEG